MGEVGQKAFQAAIGRSDAVGWLEDHNIRAMQEDDDTEGGKLVPPEHYPEILRIPERGVVEPFCRRIPMTAKQKNIPDMTSGPTVYWVAEEATITESQPVIGEKTLTAKKEAAITTVSNELLMDSRPEIQEWLGMIFIECMMLEADNQILNGTGDPCSGLLGATAGYSVVMAGGSASFSNIYYDVLSEAISKLAPTVLANARFVLNQEVLHYVRILKDSNNRPIWTPSGPGPGSIYGYPITESAKAPGMSSDASDTAFILFGNFDGFIIGDRMQISVLVNPYSLQEKAQTRLRWMRRLALTPAQPKKFVRIMTASS